MMEGRKQAGWESAGTEQLGGRGGERASIVLHHRQELSLTVAAQRPSPYCGGVCIINKNTIYDTPVRI